MENANQLKQGMDSSMKLYLARLSGRLESLSYVVQEPCSLVLLDIVEDLEELLEEKK